jgi:CIC family chloride channel protein
VNRRDGLASAFASIVTLSTGGSTGREGPVVHLAAPSRPGSPTRMRADGITGRDLLGCAVAAAVSASFNAPIAGALFALEVVLRHFAVHAFAPIVVASARARSISRLVYGDVTEFTLPPGTRWSSTLETARLLAARLLVCGLVAVVILMRAIFFAEDRETARQAARLARWLRPALAGAMLGGIAIFFPAHHRRRLRDDLARADRDVASARGVVFARSRRRGGDHLWPDAWAAGCSRPSLMVGALTGLAFGLWRPGSVPEVSGSVTLYALAGMGAVAAAVLGAPISTTLIVFELTGFIRKSFFLAQLALAGVNISEAPRTYAMRAMKVRAYMRLIGDDDGPAASACEALMAQDVFCARKPAFPRRWRCSTRRSGQFIPVVAEREGGSTELVGALYHVDALKALNRLYAATYREEHS